MKVSEIMTREVEVINPDATLEQAAAKMRQLDVGPLPVCDGDRLQGMVTDRDITIRATSQGLDPKTTKVREVMTPEVVWVYEDADVKEAAKKMEEHQIRRIVVLTHDKRLTGILSLGDIAVDTGEEKLSGQVLEEVSTPSHPKR